MAPSDDRGHDLGYEAYEHGLEVPFRDQAIASTMRGKEHRERKESAHSDAVHKGAGRYDYILVA